MYEMMQGCNTFLFRKPSVPLIRQGKRPGYSGFLPRKAPSFPIPSNGDKAGDLSLLRQKSRLFSEYSPNMRECSPFSNSKLINFATLLGR